MRMSVLSEKRTKGAVFGPGFQMFASETGSKFDIFEFESFWSSQPVRSLRAISVLLRKWAALPSFSEAFLCLRDPNVSLARPQTANLSAQSPGT
jgi:hypothetical protein